MMKRILAVVCCLLPTLLPAQMSGHASDMSKPASVRSEELRLTGLTGKSRTLTPADFRVLPHSTVTVHNAHSNKDESYSGVPVNALLTLVNQAMGTGAKVSRNMQIVVAGATDNFYVALTLCDTDPECRSGQAIVADTMDGSPLAADGAFKLILTEDKKPARWARNLKSLVVKAASSD